MKECISATPHRKRKNEPRRFIFETRNQNEVEKMMENNLGYGSKDYDLWLVFVEDAKQDPQTHLPITFPRKNKRGGK